MSSTADCTVLLGSTQADSIDVCDVLGDAVVMMQTGGSSSSSATAADLAAQAAVRSDAELAEQAAMQVDDDDEGIRDAVEAPLSNMHVRVPCTRCERPFSSWMLPYPGGPQPVCVHCIPYRWRFQAMQGRPLEPAPPNFSPTPSRGARSLPPVELVEYPGEAKSDDAGGSSTTAVVDIAPETPP